MCIGHKTHLWIWVSDRLNEVVALHIWRTGRRKSEHSHRFTDWKKNVAYQVSHDWILKTKTKQTKKKKKKKEKKKRKKKTKKRKIPDWSWSTEHAQSRTSTIRRWSLIDTTFYASMWTDICSPRSQSNDRIRLNNSPKLDFNMRRVRRQKSVDAC